MLARFNIGGRGIAHRDELLPASGQLIDAFTAANEFAATRRMNISANVCLPRCIINPAHYPRIHISACSSRISQRPVTVDYEGNVRMCNHSPRVMGTIHQMPMATILSSDYAQSWQTVRPPLCADCSKWTDCGGGCRAAAEQCGGTLFDEDPMIDLLGQSGKNQLHYSLV
jgi:radical SAM protein with 4Fe4S-binding SPASM domain